MSRPLGSKNKIKESFGSYQVSRIAGATQPPPPLTNAQLFEELGSSGLTRFGGNVSEEFLHELLRKGAPKVYKEMRENSPVVSAILFAIEMSLRRVSFHFESPDDKDHELSDFLDSCLEDMSTSWQDTLSQILTMLQFGYSVHELVYKVRKGMDKSPESKYNDGRIGWRKWLPLAQETMNDWIWDETGGVQGVNQIAPPDYKLRTLPIEKLMLFRTSVAKNNPEGRSLLRSMYIPWYYAKNFGEIEGIAMERMGCGIPVMYMGYDTVKSGTSSDVEFAKQVVRDTRTDEQMGVVIPYPKMTADGKGMLFEIVSTANRSSLEFDTVISRYEKRMAMSCLSEFIMLGMESVGSYALSKDSTDMFILANTAWAQIICDVIQRHAVPRLLKLNSFRYDEMPQLVHSEINVPDLPGLAAYVNSLVGAQLLIPDNNLEDYLRESAHLPKKPEGAITIQDQQKQVAQQAADAKQMQLDALKQVVKPGETDSKETQPKSTKVEEPKSGDSLNPGTQAPARGLPSGAKEKASAEFMGGQGSGNFGHEGRPGEVGGSGEGGGNLSHTEHQKSLNPNLNHGDYWITPSGKLLYLRDSLHKDSLAEIGAKNIGDAIHKGYTRIMVSDKSAGIEVSYIYPDALFNVMNIIRNSPDMNYYIDGNIGAGNKQQIIQKLNQYIENMSSRVISESFQAQTRRAYGGAAYETRTNEYQRQLEAIYADWQDGTAKKLAKEDDEEKRKTILTAALVALLSMLVDAGRAGLLEAMQLGAGGTISPRGFATLEQLVTNNETWLENSLIPAIETRAITDMHDPAFMLGGVAALGATLGVFMGRVASYAGGYFNAIMNGIGDAVAEDPEASNLRIERVIDPNAAHCKTCPGKAKVYDNWDSMVAEAGIPGDGSDMCWANCRCTLKIETVPNSGVFERYSAKQEKLEFV